MSSPPRSEADIYEPGFVARLFDEMSGSYGLVNYVCSFGFCARWRRQCVEPLLSRRDRVVIDLMTGMGECWEFIRRTLDEKGRVIAVDLSTAMCRRAQRRLSRFASAAIEVHRMDALGTTFPSSLADSVVACFGLKTFSAVQTRALAAEVWRLLKPGGVFSFVEIAVPTASALRWAYLAYLRYVVPVIGWLFLGNPENYRMLSVYTERFGTGEAVGDTFRARGFEVSEDALFFGCARRIRGRKPAERGT